MKIKVSEEGVLIPKALLGNSQEVEVIQEEERIVIMTIEPTASIWDLGKHPVECDVTDGAVNHDCYLYNQ